MIRVGLMHGNMIWYRVIQVEFILSILIRVYVIWVKFIWYRLIGVAVSQVNMNQIRFFGLNFFNFKNFSCPAFLEILFQTRSLLFPAPLIKELKLVKHNRPLNGNLITMLISGLIVPMGQCWFTPVRLSIFHQNPLLWTSAPLLKLLREEYYQSLCTHTITWLDCTMFFWIVGSFQRTPRILKGCTIPI